MAKGDWVSIFLMFSDGVLHLRTEIDLIQVLCVVNQLSISPSTWSFFVVFTKNKAVEYSVILCTGCSNVSKDVYFDTWPKDVEHWSRESNL